MVVQVTAIVRGQVTFDSSRVGAATVSTADGASVRTDANGNFTLQNVQVNLKTGYVKVEKQGFFASLRTFLTTNGIIPPLSIELISKAITGRFQAPSGGTVTGAPHRQWYVKRAVPTGAGYR